MKYTKPYASTGLLYWCYLTHNSQKVWKYFALTLLICFEMCTLPDDDQACSEQAGIW